MHAAVCAAPRFANQLHSLHSSMAKVHADSTATLQHLATRLNLTLPQQQHAAALDAPPADAAAVDRVLAALKDRQPGAGAASPLNSFVKQGANAQLHLQLFVEQLQAAAERVMERRTQLSKLQAQSNPYSAAVQQLQRQLAAQQQDLEAQQHQQADLEGKVGPGCCPPDNELVHCERIPAQTYHGQVMDALRICHAMLGTHAALNSMPNVAASSSRAHCMHACMHPAVHNPPVLCVLASVCIWPCCRSVCGPG